MKTLLYFAGCMLVLCQQANAQQNTKKDTTGKQAPLPQHKLLLMAAAAGDSVILRWAPADPIDWKLAGQQGYILERTTLGEGNKVLVRFEKLNQSPIMPWSKETFLQRISKDRKEDKFCAIAAQALYGASFKPALQNNTPAPDEFSMLMKQHNEDEMRHSFALFAADVDGRAAGALGLRYVDKNVEKDKKYIYRLYAIPRKGLLEMDTALFIVAPKDAKPLNRVTFVQGGSHDNAVFLQWPKNALENNFTAFFIERSDDNGKTFTQLNKEPFTNVNGNAEQLKNTVVTFADTVPQLYKKYIYRVRGVNAFAQYSPYSLAVNVMAKDDKAPSPPVINTSVKVNARTYNISWRYDEKASDIKGYYVNRSKRIDSNFVHLNKAILPPSTRVFTDSSATPGQSYYYDVTIIDTAGNASTSLPDYVFTYDSIPPAAPVGLTGNIDTNGVVTIKWGLAKEEDIKGYRIYKANAIDHAFTAVSKNIIEDTTFTDTIILKTLTRDVYYKVIAVDNNLNNSSYSNALQLIKPDVVPPVPAVFTNYVTSDTSIQLFWNKSSSVDLSKQYLYRKSTGNDWVQVAAFNNRDTVYTDTAMQKQTLYSYQIISVDSAGLKSAPSFPLNAQTFAKSSATQGDIRVTLQDSTSIKIDWTFKNNKQLTGILLYKSINGGTLSIYKNIPATQNGYTDKQIEAGNAYTYSIKCICAGNGEGVLSKAATVTVKR